MAHCVICGCELSGNPFSIKDKYQLLNRSFICKTCAHKIGITSIWEASIFTAEKAKERYNQWYPRQVWTQRRDEDTESVDSSRLYGEEQELENNELLLPLVCDIKELSTILCETDTDSQQEICNKFSEGDATTENLDSFIEKEQEYIYSFPPISLLKVKSKDDSFKHRNLSADVFRLQDILYSLEIDAKVVNIIAGPLSVRYEVKVELGVRLAEIQHASSEIAFALGCENVSIMPVVGKCSIVGIDAPKSNIEVVYLREVLDTALFKAQNSSIAFALGKSVVGDNIVCDLSKERHLLIAGTTGSGKSTLIDSMVISMLQYASPDDVRFVMVDTKGFQLTLYNGIPHMLFPVVTDVRKAESVMNWLEVEAQKRLRLFSECGARNIESYNRKMIEYGDSKMPDIVAVLDDVFHLLDHSNDSLEEIFRNLILRGHIVGIHLVLVTQYAYTGAIVKIANLRNMARIAFALPSRLDSIALLGKDGADKLFRNGEMLYLSIGGTELQHIQGCYVSDSEVVAVTDYIKAQFSDKVTVPANMDKKTQKLEEKLEDVTNKFVGDEMLPTAVESVLEIGQVSVSMLQRRLKLSYSRAARIVDEMEKMGVVGPFEGSKPRRLLITSREWENMKRDLLTNNSSN